MFPLERVTVLDIPHSHQPWLVFTLTKCMSGGCKSEMLQVSMHFPDQWCGFMYFYMLALLNLLDFFFLLLISKTGDSVDCLSAPHTLLWCPSFSGCLPALRRTTVPHGRDASHSYRSLSLSHSPSWDMENNNHAKGLRILFTTELPPCSQKYQYPPKHHKICSITRLFRTLNKALSF